MFSRQSPCQVRPTRLISLFARELRNRGFDFACRGKEWGGLSGPLWGPVKSPLVIWGPYLWGDGLQPRQADGLIWEQRDFSFSDGTHPSPSGSQKVANLLLRFFKEDPSACSWFLRSSTGVPAKSAAQDR